MLTKSQRELVDDLAGQHEIAAATGESKSLVSMWVRSSARNSFPAPVVVLAAGPFYRLSEVLEWRRTYVPRKGMTKLQAAER